MELALLVDFGSTYTKITVADIGKQTLVGTSKAFTTVETNIMEGFLKALTELESTAGLSNPPYKYKVACSSAAGGLRMIAIGLVPDLTVEAAKRAVFGAGARVIGVFAHELTKAEVGKIVEQNPDIILLAGGTNGGNRSVIIHNASMLAGSTVGAPIVVAGNKSAAEEVCSILAKRGKDVRLTENVMPELNILNIDPARTTIREVFLQKIVAAKGLNKVEQFIDRVLMPTPAAVLTAAELLANGTAGEPGLGELMVIDVGGATTDVYSIADGAPTKAGVSLRGLPEPFAKRTVEGDLGMRHSARALAETAGLHRLGQSAGISGQEIEKHIDLVSCNPEILGSDDIFLKIDTAMAFTAVELAMERHVGKIEVVYTPFGASYVQTGKDLTDIKYLIGSGGVIAFHNDPAAVIKGALFDKTRPEVLKPITPQVLVDREYILAGMGLMAQVDPLSSLKIMKKYLVPE